MSAVTANGPVTADRSLALLCGRVRPELAALGDLGGPLVDALAAVERAGCDRGIDALSDPGFALDVLTTAGPGTEAAVVGRVLDFLRTRLATSPAAAGSTATALREVVTVRTAVDRYLSGPLALTAEGTRKAYRTWARRLVAAHGDRDPASLTAGDLRDLVATWVVTIRSADRTEDRRQGGKVAERNAVAALRHLWGYLVEKRWAQENVAMALRKPPTPDSRRRPWRLEEAAVVRHLARTLGRDPLVNEVLVSIAERMGLRRTELRRLRLCDVDLDRRVATVWGKGDKDRETPIPPVLAGLLEHRRPPDIQPDAWRHSTEPLLRTRPTPEVPHGKQIGETRPDTLFESLRAAAPELFAGEDLSLHCYRHALGTWTEPRYGRKATRSILGHRGRKDPTDYYVWVPLEEQARILAEYEAHLLAVAPSASGREENPGSI